MEHGGDSPNFLQRLVYTLRNDKAKLPPNYEDKNLQARKNENNPLDYIDYSRLHDQQGFYEKFNKERIVADNEQLHYDIRLEPFKQSNSPRAWLEKKGLPDKINEHAKIISHFIVQGKNSNTIINIHDLLPEGYKVVFQPEVLNTQGVCSTENKTVYIWGDIGEPSSLISLLHEIGHARRSEKIKKEDPRHYELYNKAWRFLRTNMYSSQSELEEIINDERDAWSFCLNALRPMIRAKDHSSLSYANLHDHIHNGSLRSYHHKIGVKIGVLEELPAFFASS